MGNTIAKQKSNFQLPPIVEKYFDFCVWLLQKVSKFPKDQRYLLGQRIENLCLTILELLIKGALQKKGGHKLSILINVNTKLEQLRYLLRLSAVIKMMNHKSHHYGSKLLMEIGNATGAWIKSMQQKEAQL